MRRLPRAPLFLQTLGLVIATLAAAQLATALVIFSLPPPRAEVYTVEDVAAVVQGLKPPDTNARAPLIARRQASPPPMRVRGPFEMAFRADLAESLGVAQEQVVISQNGGRLLPFDIPRHHQHRFLGRRPAPLLFGAFEVGVRQTGGGWLVVAPKTSFGVDPWQQRLLLVLALAILAVAPLAWIFSRRLTRPFVMLAAGAQRLGRDPNAPALVIPGGSPEAVAAVMAFNEMQERLQSYVAERTAMVAAMAHDLRTPLTRLRFRAEQIPGELGRKAAADIDQMDAMIGDALNFVRDAAPLRRRERLELASLVETVMDETPNLGDGASFGGLDRAVVAGDPLALRRLLANLIENAVKFGGAVTASVRVLGESVTVLIEDRGPGIPEDQLKRVFEPFYRLETSRNRDTGGAGLGLAAVRAIASAHGGEVVLRNRPGGGLAAELRLPLAPRG